MCGELVPACAIFTEGAAVAAARCRAQCVPANLPYLHTNLPCVPANLHYLHANLPCVQCRVSHHPAGLLLFTLTMVESKACLRL